MRYLALAAVIASGLIISRPALAHSADNGQPHFQFADVTLDVPMNNAAPEAPLKTLLGEVLMALGALLLIGTKIGLGYLVQYLREKGKSNKLINALALATELVSTTVAKAEVELKPLFAKALEDGSISPEEGAKLKEKVMEILKRDMPAQLWGTLQGALGPAVESWLSGKVEQAVAAQKVPGSP